MNIRVKVWQLYITLNDISNILHEIIIFITILELNFILIRSVFIKIGINFIFADFMH